MRAALQRALDRVSAAASSARTQTVMSGVEGTVMFSWSCDACMGTLSQGEVRFCCEECGGVDFCAACVDRGEVHPHPLVPETDHYTALALRMAECDDPGAAVTTAAALFAQRTACTWFTPELGTRSMRHGEFHERAAALARKLRAPPLSLSPGDRVVICGDNSPWWLAADFACALAGLVSVPLHTVLTPAIVSHVVGHTRARAALVDAAAAEWFAESGVPLLLLAEGDDDDDDDDYDDFPLHRFQHAELCSIMMTSGSTGTPKGVPFSAEHWLARVLPRGSLTRQPRWFSMAPLAHGLDRVACWGTMLQGGRVFFASGDKTTLPQELLVAAPTSLAAAPAFWTGLRDEFEAELLRRAALPGARPKWELRQELLEAFSRRLGANIKGVTTGGAPTPPAVKAFLHECFASNGVGVSESYGTTEVGSIARDGRIDPDVTCELRPVPDLGYEGGDVGEVVVRKFDMPAGYYENEDESADRFVDGGWYRTGDIGRRLPSGHVVLIDRIKNVFKLAQGEFVAPARLEGVYAAVPLVRQVFVTGSCEARSVVAVVVPHAPDADEAAVLRALRAAGAAAKLAPHELPCAVLLEARPFSVENALLTGSNKLARGKLEAHYRQAVADLYARAAASRSPVDRIIEYCRGADDDALLEDGDCDEPLAMIAVDSIAAAQLAAALRDELGLRVPLRVLLSPSMTVGALRDLVREGFSASAVATDAADAEAYWAAQTELPADVDPSQCGGTEQEEEEEEEEGDVLLTGATGFLGPHLVAALLRAFPSAHLYALVRGDSNEHARDRVLELVGAEGLQLADRSRLHALAADLEAPEFGLTAAVWRMLDARVGAIVHSAAVVNAVLPYEKLRAANVDSTLTLMRLACRGRRKALTLVSSTSAEHRGSGYGQSKWVAERLVDAARERGMAAGWLRLGFLGPSRLSGRWNPSDWLGLLLAVVRRVGAAPREAEHGCLSFVPVDDMAAEVAACVRADPRRNRTLSGPRLGSMLSLFDLAGLELLPYAEWLARFGDPSDRFWARAHAVLGGGAVPSMSVSAAEEPLEVELPEEYWAQCLLVY